MESSNRLADDTAPKLAASPAHNTEASLRLLIDSIQDYAIYMLDPKGYIVTWNKGAQRIKGYTADEILGRHVSTFYTAEAIAGGWPDVELREAAARGRLEDEGWRVRKDGSTFWANVVITAMRGPAGELTGYAKVTRDMSERKRLEEMEQANRRMTEFLAVLGHELRNPLAPVRNAIGILQMDTKLRPEVARCRDMIDRQIGQLTRLVDDLLNVGRIVSGKIGLRMERVNIEDVVHCAIESSRFFADGRNQCIEASLPAEPLAVKGDMTRLVQVVHNLLHNASKFSPPDTAIQVKVRRESSTAIIEVSDQGRGIPEQALDTIFQLFMQESRANNPSDSGLGIGLTLCRSLARLHGGSITARSEGEGRGSVFTVRLPLAQEPAPEETAPARAGPRAEPQQALRVLVVDDNRDSADSLAMLLQIKGHETRALYHADDAVRAAPRYQPDVVFIDLAMPRMDGFAALSVLKTAPELRGTTFVAMTGYGQEHDRRHTREAGFHDHLVKPIDLEELDRLMRGLAGG
jgi:PAS domain S-box-containing protein